MDATNRVPTREAGGIPPLVALISTGTDGQKHNAAGALWNLAEDASNTVPIREAGGIPPLVALISVGTDGQKHNDAGALWQLVVDATNSVPIHDALKPFAADIEEMLEETINFFLKCFGQAVDGTKVERIDRLKRVITGTSKRKATPPSAAEHIQTLQRDQLISALVALNFTATMSCTEHVLQDKLLEVVSDADSNDWDAARNEAVQLSK